MANLNLTPEEARRRWLESLSGFDIEPIHSAIAKSPSYHMVFIDPATGHEIGKLMVQDGVIDFQGSATESAQQFFDKLSCKQ